MSQRCTVCGQRIDSNARLPMIQHSKKHYRQFKERYGRDPEDYDEVRQHICTEYDSEEHILTWRDGEPEKGDFGRPEVTLHDLIDADTGADT